jgi:hypothetical protein
MQHFLCLACALGQNRGAAQSLRVRQRVGLNTPVESFGHVLLPCQIQIGSTVSGSDFTDSTQLHARPGNGNKL